MPRLLLDSGFSGASSLARASPLGTLLPPGLIRQYGRDLASLQKLADPAAAVMLMAWLERGLPATPASLESLLGVVGACLLAVILPSFGIYHSFRERSLLILLARLLLAWLTVMGLIACGLFVMKTGPDVSRRMLMVWSSLLLTWLLLSHALSRLALRRLRVLGQNARRDGYVGSWAGFQRLRERMLRDAWRGHAVWPVLTWERGQGPEPRSLRRIRRYADRGLIDQWIVEDTGSSHDLALVLGELEQHTTPVLLIPSWLRDRHGCPQPCEVAGMPALQLWATQATPLKLRLKYTADKGVSLLLILLLAPLLALLALLVVIDSPGPVLFAQRRYGINGRPFRCYKFRTMGVLEDGACVTQATRDDPRVTRVGHWLRRSNLDELPQLLNVLRGDMSLVGPRPHAEAHNEYYRTRVDAYMRRHTLRPGITGWAQVLGYRGETRTLAAMQQRVHADLDYIHNWSLVLDVEILLLTLLRWSGSNAY